MAGNNLVQDSAEEVDITVPTDLCNGSSDHFRSHVERRSGSDSCHLAGSGNAGSHIGSMYGQAPVEHDNFAEVTQHDVVWL